MKANSNGKVTAYTEITSNNIFNNPNKRFERTSARQCL